MVNIKRSLACNMKTKFYALKRKSQKRGTGTLFCCFTVLVTSDRNIIFPTIPMVSLELYNVCISISYII